MSFSASHPNEIISTPLDSNSRGRNLSVKPISTHISASEHSGSESVSSELRTPEKNSVSVHYSQPEHSDPYYSPLSPISDAHLPEKSSISYTQLLSSSNRTPISPTSPTSEVPDPKPCEEPRDRSLDSPITFECMKRRLASSFFMYFVGGWGDGVTGTILPYFEADFHLSYMTSSLLFVASTVGFACATLLLERVMVFLGRFYLSSTSRSFLPAVPFISRYFRMESLIGKDPVFCGGVGHSASQARYIVLVLGSILHATFFVIMGSKKGYASMLVGYAISAFARAFLTASLNAYVASTPKKPLGYILAFWSSGSFAAPLVCQTVIATGVPWPYFYFGSLVLSAINTSFLVYAFRPTKNEYIAERQAAIELVRSRLGVRASTGSTAVDFRSNLFSAGSGTKSRSSSVTCVNAPPPINTLQRALSMPYQWAFSTFSWIYSGSETTVQGFTVTYLLATRHANPQTAGYVTSGFWGGMAMSRFFWGHYTPLWSFTQRKHIIHACITLALVMHLLIWFVNSNIENAFSTALLGFLYGPIFPGTLGLANDVLPEEVHMVSMAITSAFSSFGSALFPFITGAISNIKGPYIMSYVTVAQTATLFLLWCLIPSKKPLRAENYS